MKKIEKKKKNEGKNITRWHHLLAKMLEELLTPVDITVIQDFPIMSSSPEADILLIRRDHTRWTQEQLMRLPDGIRDTRADHILIEFKYTESVNKAAMAQALAYDTFYRRIQKSLKQERIQTFIVSSRTPGKRVKEKFGYTKEKKPGVYHSTCPMLDSLHMISINELSDECHNDFFKCFASRKKENQRAFKMLLQSGQRRLSAGFYYLISGLGNIIFHKRKGGTTMEREFTPKLVTEMGKELREMLLNGLRPEDFLPRFKPEEILAGLKPEEILANFKPEEILAGFKPEEILAGLKPEEILANFKPEEVLANFKPEEILSAFSIEDIEKFLDNKKAPN